MRCPAVTSLKALAAKVPSTFFTQNWPKKTHSQLAARFAKIAPPSHPAPIRVICGQPSPPRRSLRVSATLRETHSSKSRCTTHRERLVVLHKSKRVLLARTIAIKNRGDFADCTVPSHKNTRLGRLIFPIETRCVVQPAGNGGTIYPSVFHPCSIRGLLLLRTRFLGGPRNDKPACGLNQKNCPPLCLCAFARVPAPKTGPKTSLVIGHYFCENAGAKSLGESRVTPTLRMSHRTRNWPQMSQISADETRSLLRTHPANLRISVSSAASRNEGEKVPGIVIGHSAEPRSQPTAPRPRHQENAPRPLATSTPRPSPKPAKKPRFIPPALNPLTRSAIWARRTIE